MRIESVVPSVKVFNISRFSDDAEELSNGTMLLNRGALRMVEDGKEKLLTGVRFDRVELPPGAEIVEAYLQFTVDVESESNAVLRLQAEASNEAPTFKNDSGSISNRSLTDEDRSVTWAVEVWNARGDAEESQRSPDLTPIIDELIEQHGWVNGDPLVLVISGSGLREAKSYDGSRHQAPQLIIRYIENQEPFTAYNDLSWNANQLSANISRYTTDDTASGLTPEGNRGYLVNHSTGRPLPVYLEVSGGNWNAAAHSGIGGPGKKGTDAYDVFNSILNSTGVVSYAESDIELEIKGLSPRLRYEVVVFGNRGSRKHASRVSHTRLEGAVRFNNKSSDGVLVKSHQELGDTTIISNGYNTENGYVARYVDIDPGIDGEIKLIQTSPGSPSSGTHYVSALMVRGTEPSLFVAKEFRGRSRDDDAEEALSDGTVNLTSTDLELGEEIERGVGSQIVAVRFRDISIPRGSDVQKAYLQFTVDEISEGPCVLAIAGEAEGSASLLREELANVSSRSFTSVSIPWEPTAWNTVGEDGLRQRTPDLSSILQEIVDQDDWEPGNAVLFVITGSGMRTAESFNSGLAVGPKLHVEFSEQTSGPDSESRESLGLDFNEESVASTGELETKLPLRQTRVGLEARDFLADVVTSSDLSEEHSGWMALDGDKKTMWVGDPAESGWWILLSYSQAFDVYDVELVLGSDSAQAASFLTSLDTKSWTDLQSLLSGEWTLMKYLWIVFEEDELGQGVVPKVREITLE